MKKLIFTLIILFVVIVNVNSQTGWFTVYNPTKWITNLYFIDINTGYASGSGIIAKTTNAGNNWTALHTASSPVFLDVFFINSTTGFCCGDNGFTSPVVWKTINGGINWIETLLNNPGHLAFCVYFTDANTGYVTTGNKIFKTVDCGNSWALISEEPIAEFVWLNASTGFGYSFVESTYYTSIKKTIDGGITWTVKGSAYNVMRSIFMYDANTGYVAGQYNRIFKTTDSGESWFNLNYINPEELIAFYAICFPDVNTGYAIGEGDCDHYIYKSTNGGVNWWSPSTFTSDIVSMVFLNKYTGYVCGVNLISKTITGSEASVPVTPESTIEEIISLRNDIYDLLNSGIISQGNAEMLISKLNNCIKQINLMEYDVAIQRIEQFIFGVNLLVEKTLLTQAQAEPLLTQANDIIEMINSLIGGDKLKGNLTQNKKFSLEQNYPNPFNSMTNVKWQMLNAGIAKLTVYDLLGKEVAKLVNEYKRAGTYEITFDAKDLPSGIYFYVLETGQFRDVKRMILIK